MYKFIRAGIEYIKPKVFHKNPIDVSGSLVTYDYGRDLPCFINSCSGLSTTIFNFQNLKLGLDGEYLYVFLSLKS